MKMIIHKTNVRLPNAPIVRPIIEINRFNVGHDLANLNTRSYVSSVCNSIMVQDNILQFSRVRKKQKIIIGNSFEFV